MAQIEKLRLWNISMLVQNILTQNSNAISERFDKAYFSGRKTVNYIF